MALRAPSAPLPAVATGAPHMMGQQFA